MNLFKIKDECRKNLTSHTIKAFSMLPASDNPLILDAGCGTGVSSLALLEVCNVTICAVDTDQASLEWFKEKAVLLNLKDRITIIHDSILKPALFDVKFDVILAEGLLNVIGFENGLKVLVDYLKRNGFLLIHDEMKNDEEKRQYFKSINVQLIQSFELHEDVWLDEYFYCLKSKLESIRNPLADAELKEVEENIRRPENLRSIYYILRHAE